MAVAWSRMASIEGWEGLAVAAGRLVLADMSAREPGLRDC